MTIESHNHSISSEHTAGNRVGGVLDEDEKLALSILGHTLVINEKYQDAITLFEVIRSLDPIDIYPIKVLAYAYMEVNRYDDALAAVLTIRRADKVNDEDIAVLSLIEGRCLIALDKEDDGRRCLAEYKRAIQLK